MCLCFLPLDAIILDTICLKMEAGRTTEKDIATAVRLEYVLPDIDRQTVFDGLQAAKFDITGRFS